MKYEIFKNLQIVQRRNFSSGFLVLVLPGNETPWQASLWLKSIHKNKFSRSWSIIHVEEDTNHTWHHSIPSHIKSRTEWIKKKQFQAYCSWYDKDLTVHEQTSRRFQGSAAWMFKLMDRWGRSPIHFVNTVPRDFSGIPLVTYLETRSATMVGAEGREKFEIVPF